MSLESDWVLRKQQVHADLEALVAVGIPLDTARRLAIWDPTMEYSDFSIVSAFPPPSPFPSPNAGIRDSLTLRVSRSAARVNSISLESAVLDAGKLYAIFVPNIAELGMTSVSFKLNGSTVHTEFSNPWDYAATGPGGDANRVTFVVGDYTIEVTVTDSSGSSSFESSFSVE